MMEDPNPDTASDRRRFLKTASAALTIVSAGTTQDALSSESTDVVGDKNQPESFWRERMKQPDDDRKLGWFVDTRRCVGCHACEVSCKSENDVPLGNYIRQTFYKDVGEYPKVARMFMPMACQHCEDAPCIKACPCGALHKESGGTVVVDYNQCCGHGSCIDVCPYGAIYLDPVAKQAVKCHNCYHRTDVGMEPACVPTCPSDALHFGDLNDPTSRVSKAMKAAEDADVELTQLRTDKDTKPRMWFSGPAPPEVEPSIPKEGESYSGDAYDIYNWKKRDKE